MDKKRLQHLLTLYLSDRIERQDCEELLQYLDETGQHSDDLRSILDESLAAQSPNTRFDPTRKALIFDQLKSAIAQQATPVIPLHRRPVFRWLKVAAVLIVMLTAGWWIYSEHATDVPAQAPVVRLGSTSDIRLPEPGQAVLTLASGQKILLSDTAGAMLAAEGGVAIQRTANGGIRYDASAAEIHSGQMLYNTLATPKGQSYQIKLPDGTEVWLNSSSSLHYPVAFTGQERRVVLTGEAYFEVAKVPGKTFLVDAGGSTTKVMGTHFNVSSYPDEGVVTTTLIEGSVEVSKNKEKVQLTPGKQAVVQASTGVITQGEADIRSVLAWKNGYFRFENETLKSMMTKISRWYDIEDVIYQGEFDDRFTGTFQRSKAISQLFSHLEKLAPVRFEIKERRVYIMR